MRAQPGALLPDLAFDADRGGQDQGDQELTDLHHALTGGFAECRNHPIKATTWPRTFAHSVR
ncbi:hypothetical protein GCM10023191_061850 [Actinoallomurus oryzae]|uniref:Uncharacterized protein n=1 Tax=Actinoallomurus oryzae TaxID=502180 RepID=A0ABP8QNS4_9ACTN